MRILMAVCAPRGREGGSAGIMMNYADALEKRGHKVTALFAEDLLAPGERSSRFSDLRFSARLSRYILSRPGEYSIVNLQAPDGFVYGLHRRFRGMAAPPYVAQATGMPENVRYALSREAKKKRYANFSLKNRVWHRFYHATRYDWSVRTADAAHSYCRDIWMMLRLKFDFDDHRTAYIPNGVSRQFLVDRQYTGSKPLRLLYAGTWLEQRGIFYLRDVLPRIFAKYPDARMTFAGPGVPAEVIFGFMGEDISRRLDIIDKIPSCEMPALYARHDVLVFPSLLEGQPCVVLEAMASGMPVITTETCGMVDVIDHGQDGLLIPPGDGAALEEAILQMAQSSALRERLGRAARVRMTGRSWEQAATRLESLFHSVLGRNHRQ